MTSGDDSSTDLQYFGRDIGMVFAYGVVFFICCAPIVVFEMIGTTLSNILTIWQRSADARVAAGFSSGHGGVGDEETLEEQHEKRGQNRDKSKQKKFDKRVKELRVAVRSSLWRKDSGSHEHDFGEETYDEDEEMYSKTCKSCGHVMT